MISSDDSDRYDRYDSDVSGPKKFIHHKKKQQPLQTGRFSGPLSHLARPANDKDAKPSVTHISVSCICKIIHVYIYNIHIYNKISFVLKVKGVLAYKASKINFDRVFAFV